MHQGRYIFVLTGFALLLIVGAYIFQDWRKATQPVPAPTPTEETSPSPSTSDSPATSSGSTYRLETMQTQVSDAEIRITFSPELQENAQDMAAIRQRIIEPYIMYQRDLAGTQALQTLEIATNPNASAKEYPFIFTSLFEGGVEESFLISRQGDSVNWFVPECLNGCSFSESFRQKYPEIIARSEGKQ